MCTLFSTFGLKCFWAIGSDFLKISFWHDKREKVEELVHSYYFFWEKLKESFGANTGFKLSWKNEANFHGQSSSSKHGKGWHTSQDKVGGLLAIIIIAFIEERESVRTWQIWNLQLGINMLEDCWIVKVLCT